MHSAAARSQGFRPQQRQHHPSGDGRDGEESLFKSCDGPFFQLMVVHGSNLSPWWYIATHCQSSVWNQFSVEWFRGIPWEDGVGHVPFYLNPNVQSINTRGKYAGSREIDIKQRRQWHPCVREMCGRVECQKSKLQLHLKRIWPQANMMYSKNLVFHISPPNRRIVEGVEHPLVD